MNQFYKHVVTHAYEIGSLKILAIVLNMLHVKIFSVVKFLAHSFQVKNFYFRNQTFHPRNTSEKSCDVGTISEFFLC